MGDHVSSTFSIADGYGQLTMVAENYDNSGWYNRNSVFTNGIMKIDMIGTTSLPQFHFKEVDAANLIFSYFNTNIFTLGSEIGSAFVTRSVCTPSNFDNSSNYTIVAKIYENRISTYVMEDNVVKCNVYWTDDFIAENINPKNGIGVESGTAYYDNYESHKIDDFINVIALGDSNTRGYSLTDYQSYPMQLATLMLDENVDVINSGVDGNKAYQVSARLSTDVIPNYVNNAKNIVVLQIGVNDLAASDNISGVFTNITKVWTELQEGGFDVWAVTVPPRDSYMYGLEIKALNVMIRNSTQPDKIIDLYSELVDPADDYDAREGMLKPDLIHLTEAANKVLADKIARLLLNIYGTQDISGNMNVVGNITTENNYKLGTNKTFFLGDNDESYIIENGTTLIIGRK